MSSHDFTWKHQVRHEKVCRLCFLPIHTAAARNGTSEAIIFFVDNYSQNLEVFLLLFNEIHP